MTRLPTVIAEKCVSDGIFKSTGSDGPTGQPESDAFRRVRRAPWNDLTASGGIQDNDFSDIAGMTLQQFVAGDCSVLTDDRKAEIWDDILDVAALYWQSDPELGNPFPRGDFEQPSMDCTATEIVNLSTRLMDLWKTVQNA